MQTYSDPSRAADPHALPDVEVFQLTATEVAESAAYEDEQYEFMQRPEFRLASMNSRVRDAMLSAMVDELGITGGWYYWYCFPGCLPNSDPVGPFYSAQAAEQAAQEDASC